MGTNNPAMAQQLQEPTEAISPSGIRLLRNWTLLGQALRVALFSSDGSERTHGVCNSVDAQSKG